MSSRLPDSKKTPKPGDRPKVDHVGRIVQRYFQVHDGELYIGGIPVSRLAGDFGTPIFVYDQSVILEKIRDVRSVLPDGFKLFYSIKANPNAAILALFLRQGCGLEVASGGELYQALQAGCSADQIIFAGPGKTPGELASAVRAGIREVHIESIEEARCLSRLAETDGRTVRVALRVNPIDASGGAMQMGGRPSPFGIDEEDLREVLTEVLSLSGLQVVGVHLFMGTQILDAATLTAQYERAITIARLVAGRIAGPLETIDFGGGFGTPYFPHESELDLAEVRRVMSNIAAKMKSDPLLSTAEGVLEPGRYLVNESGLYLAKVTRVKRSRGKTFAVIDGGMHHHLAASGNLGQTIKRNYPVALVNKLGQPVDEAVEVVGPLCTPLDTLARQSGLPPVEAGDLFGVFQSGAYARTSSPHGFLSHDTPAEVLIAGGDANLIRRRGQAADHLSDQCAPDAN